MKAVRDLKEEEFRELYNSSRFRVKTKEELLREGWEEGSCYSLEKEGEGVDIPFDYLESPWLHLDVLIEVDTDDYTFKLKNENGEEYWLPMDILDYSDIYIEPIVLDIPSEDFLL